MSIIKKFWRWLRRSDEIDQLKVEVHLMENVIGLYTSGVAEDMKNMFKVLKANFTNEMHKVREDVAEALLDTGHKPFVTSSIAETMEYGWVGDKHGNGFWNIPLSQDVVEQWKQQQRDDEMNNLIEEFGMTAFENAKQDYEKNDDIRFSSLPLNERKKHCRKAKYALKKKEKNENGRTSKRNDKALGASAEALQNDSSGSG